MSKVLQRCKKEKIGYGWWLFRKKGTAATKWRTAEEIWNDPEVRKIIERHNKEIKKGVK